MTYKVQLTEEAKVDLRGIYEYIAFTLLEPGIAKNIKERIIAGLKSLSYMPEKFSLYHEEPWKSKGPRRINIGNYSGFYLIAGKYVQVIRILYSGRDISSVLQES
ncbi:MAG: type II toxin-antitoxin system RelE/ParE family toxin [Lachnospiraceae bacterium]|nr:type II toxin-antitoxin system RelE/ParE family toxin [Lachnospiraceae bacterium]